MMAGNRIQRSRGEQQTRALVGLLLVRVPFLILLGCCLPVPGSIGGRQGSP